MGYAKEREQYLQDVEEETKHMLSYGRKSFKLEKKRKKRKLRFVDFNLLEEFVDLENVEFKSAQKFKAKSHNLDKQIEQFYKSMYFKYEAPRFALKYLMSYKEANRTRNPFSGEIRVFKDVIKIISTGGSVSKKLKNFFTKKECYHFLKSDRYDVNEACVDAKLKIVGFDRVYTDYILSNTSIINNPFDEKNPYVLSFIKKYNPDLNILSELIDYFYSTFEQDTKTFFSRNLENMIIGSNHWHVERIFVRHTGKKYVEWSKYYEEFEGYINEEEKIGHYLVKEVENSKDLMIEGNKMGHCVGGYVNNCLSGRSSILSLKIDGIRKITLEINIIRKEIIQAKGKYNREIYKNELKILGLFAQKNGLSIGKYL